MRASGFNAPSLKRRSPIVLIFDGWVVIRLVVKTGALFSQYATDDLNIFLERVGDEIRSVHVLGIKIHRVHQRPGSAEYNPVYSGPDAGGRTHTAWLECYIKSASAEVFHLQQCAEFSQRYNFRMSRWIMP